MATTKKYLDKAGLNYLWQKIKFGFAEKDHNHSGTYIDALSTTPDSGHVATWSNNHTLAVGNVLGRDVASTAKFVDETEFWAGDTKILAGTTGSATAVVFPYAAKGVDGVVTTTSTETSVSDGVGGWHAVPIVNGVPFYHDTLHDTYSTTGTTSSESPAFGSTFSVIDSVTYTNGHLTGYNTKTITLPTENANMVTASANIPTGNIAVGAGNNKTIKNGGYSVGGSTITGATGLLATEEAVKASIQALPVSGVTGNVLSVNSDKMIDTTLTLNFDETSKKLQLKGIGGAVVTEIDATEFVKDGFLEAAELSVRTTTGSTTTWTPALPAHAVEPSGLTDGTYLVFVWNTYDGTTKEYSSTFINVTDLIDTYTGGSGIDITSNVVSVKVDNTTNPTTGSTRVTLAAGPSGLRAEVDLSGKADKVGSATAGDIATLDASGNLVDSGKKPTDYVEKSTVIGSTGASGPSFAWNTTINLGEVDGKTFQFHTPAEPDNTTYLDQTDIEGAISDANSYISGGATGPSWHAY